LNKTVYKIICSKCSKYTNIYYTKIKNHYIRCPKCGASTFKIEIIKGSHQENTIYKINCVRCNEYFTLNYSKVKELSFPFIQCPICKQFIFKIEIMKGNRIEILKLNRRTKDIYEKYDTST